MYVSSDATVMSSAPIGHPEFQLSSPSIQMLEENVLTSEKILGIKKMSIPADERTSTKSDCQLKAQSEPAKVETSTLPS